jgi:hypothetical protein
MSEFQPEILQKVIDSRAMQSTAKGDIVTIIARELLRIAVPLVRYR